jgi:hypothetical protein
MSPSLGAADYPLPPGDDTRLARAVEYAISRHTNDSDELRGAIREYVARARAQRAAPQHVIIAVKALLQHVAMPHLPQGEYADLTARAVQWCIDEYYRQS